MNQNPFESPVSERTQKIERVHVAAARWAAIGAAIGVVPTIAIVVAFLSRLAYMRWDGSAQTRHLTVWHVLEPELGRATLGLMTIGGFCGAVYGAARSRGRRIAAERRERPR